MATVILQLNDPDSETYDWKIIEPHISKELFQEMKKRFGITGEHEEVRHELSKVLGRYHRAVRNVQSPAPSPQKREMDRLHKVVDKAMSAFEAVSDENRSAIDDEIMYRDPFNRKFLFPEQLAYWERNEASTQTAMNKLAQISHALKLLKAKREHEQTGRKTTRNTPLDHLIQDLAIDFERGTCRKAIRSCHYGGDRGSNNGQYFDFVIFILDRFAPKSYHSEGALGKRIERTLRDTAPMKDT